MRRTVLLASLLAFCASPHAAQGGHIALYSDPAGTDCGIYDTEPDGYYVYVFHVNALGATGVQFSVPNPPCSQLTYIGDLHVFNISFGDSQNGVAVAYGTCRTGTFMIMQIAYATNGLTDPCCSYPIQPDTREPSEIIGVDCNFEQYAMSGSPAIINPNATCQCSVPVEDTSWGQIKSLYQQ